MEKLNEIFIPYESLHPFLKVNDLIYYDGPLLSHYKNKFEENYLFYWIDSDEIYNRWLIIRTSTEEIDNYLTKKTTLFELISNNTFLYKVDIDDNLAYNNFSLVKVKDLPQDYLPEQNSFYPYPEKYLNNNSLRKISEKNNSGVLQLYFDSKNSKIGYGRIDLDLFSKSLSEINKISSGVQKNFIRISKEKHNQNKSKENFNTKLFQEASKLEYIGNTNGSFGALLKSKSNQISFEDLKTIEDSFMQSFVEFFEMSTNLNEFSKLIENYDKSIIENYKKLLEDIKVNDIQFNLNYFNKTSNFSTGKEINKEIAQKILSNIDSLEYNETEDLYLTGRFIALNLKTGHFIFESDDDENQYYNGHLDSDRKEMAYKINWEKIYNIVISRKELKKTGEKKSNITNILISFAEVI